MSKEPLPIEGRAQRIKCAKNTSDLYLLTADVVEGMNKITEMTCEFLAKKPDTKPEDFLTDKFTIELDVGNKDKKKERKWAATCVEATYLGMSEGMGFGEYAHFRVVLRGWPWLMTRQTDCKIFQEKTSDDIIKEIFRDRGFSDFKMQVNAAPPTRTYCVQYRESDWNFIERLLAEDGRFWYFDYADGKDMLVIQDDSASFKPIPGEAKIELIDKESAGRAETDYIDNWHALHKVQSNKVTLDDYNFETPKTDLTVNKQDDQGKREIYDYPGLYGVAADGNTLARSRIEALIAQKHRITAAGAIKELHVAGTFTLEKHPQREQNGKYMVLAVHHKLHMEEVSDGTEDKEREKLNKERRMRGQGPKPRPLPNANKSFELHSVDFEAQPADVDYRAPNRADLAPQISGIQTAVVVGPSGDEIFTDKFGRVKVQFPWDRVGKNDEKTTCFVRVSTPIAGKGWGMIHIPRIGQEVVVQFEEGNPDRPLIVGSVYNSDQTVPFALKENMTRLGFVSDTHKNDDKNAKHELWFDDKKDSEMIRMQSEKDMEQVIKNNKSVSIGSDEKKDGDYTFEVWRDTTRTYGVGSAKGNLTETVEKNFSKTLNAGDYTLEVSDGERSTNVSKDDKLEVGKNITTDAGQAITVNAGTEISLDAPSKITLTCGGSTIEMTPTKVSITAPQIEVKADAKADFESPLTTLKGSGMLTLQGGVVKIN
ncbi:MAG: type VI secretion system tip protein TssI/VgrG [Pseudomonadota bacterium]